MDEIQTAPGAPAPSATEVLPLGEEAPAPAPHEEAILLPDVPGGPQAPARRRGRPPGPAKATKKKNVTVKGKGQTKKKKATGKKQAKVKMNQVERLRALQTARGWLNRCIQAMGGE